MVPEPWAVTEARNIFLGGACRCTEETCAVHLDIAEEMQAQREMGARIGRREREAEIVAWLRREASILLGEKATPLSAAWAAAHQQAAEGIENGAVPSAE